METYSIVPAEGGWGVSQNNNRPEGSYATREGAFEAVYLAASNDIKKGHGVTPASRQARHGRNAVITLSGKRKVHAGPISARI